MAVDLEREALLTNGAGWSPRGIRKMNDNNDTHLLKRIEKSGDSLVTMVDEALTANFLAGIATIG